MPDTPDPILEAVEALRAHGITATPVGDDSVLWLVGGKVYDDAEIVALADSMKLADAADGVHLGRIMRIHGSLGDRRWIWTTTAAQRDEHELRPLSVNTATQDEAIQD